MDMIDLCTDFSVEFRRISRISIIALRFTSLSCSPSCPDLNCCAVFEHCRISSNVLPSFFRRASTSVMLCKIPIKNATKSFTLQKLYSFIVIGVFSLMFINCTFPVLLTLAVSTAWKGWKSNAALISTSFGLSVPNMDDA